MDAELKHFDAIHPEDVQSWGGNRFAPYRTRTEAIRDLAIGESLLFVVRGDTEAAAIRRSAYTALPNRATCERVMPDLVRVTRIPERPVRFLASSKEAWNKRCPICGVDVGHCKTPAGRRRSRFHTTRLRGGDE